MFIILDIKQVLDMIYCFRRHNKLIMFIKYPFLEIIFQIMISSQEVGFRYRFIYCIIQMHS